MTAAPLSLPDVVQLMALVEPGGKSGCAWGTKSRMILALATYVDGGWFNAPDAARLTGISEGRARRLLAELADQRVIVRDGGHEAGRQKVFWCEVNPEWRRWEVAWSMPLRDVETRLAFNRSDRERQPQIGRA